MNIHSKHIIFAATATLLSTTYSHQSTAFGGEDQINGAPWHHEDMTLRALAGDKIAKPGFYPDKLNVFNGTGFSRPAAESIAWHADYIDSYLYNPLWWVQGGLNKKRVKASLSMFEDLAKMHHDDTFSSGGVNDNWKRYAAGTLAGLYWASTLPEEQGIAAAHNILGVSSHAVQDFYSHSSWMNDSSRWTKTWLESPVNSRAAGIYVGAYEHPATQAPAHHGAYSMVCSAINGTGAASVISEVCGGYSPFQNLSICEDFRACRSGTPVRLSLAGYGPDNFVYLQPKGIALDNTWLAVIGGQERGILNSRGLFIGQYKRLPNYSKSRCNSVINFGRTFYGNITRAEQAGAVENGRRVCKADSDYLFAYTKELAIRSTEEWMRFIEKAMINMGPAQKAFWEKVKQKGSPMNRRIAQFENFANIPFQFLSSGPYPVGNTGSPARTSDGWYLRIRLHTSSDVNSGTDADIKVKVEGRGYSRTMLLDYLPTSNAQGRTSSPLLVYNDFEAGDNDVYTIGPFPRQPAQITLINDSADAGDVVEAAWDDFVDGLDETLTDVRRSLLSIIGGNADLIDTKSTHYTARQLARNIRASGGTFNTSLYFNGGSANGRFKIYYTVKNENSALSNAERRKGWKAFRITLNKLKCIDESTVDGFLSDSDEIFTFFTVSPINGRSSQNIFSYRAGPGSPFDDVDAGENISYRGNKSFVFKLPPHGGVAIAGQLWESDEENSYDRNQLFKTFKTGIDEETRRGNGKFLTALGKAVAEDWKLADLEVFGFYRGARPKVMQKTRIRNIGWINGGQRKTFNLSSRPPKNLLTSSQPDVSKWYYLKPINYVDLLGKTTGIARVPEDNAKVILDVKPQSSIIDKILLPTNPADVWAGQWKTTFGNLDLSVNGTKVTGKYSNKGDIDALYDSSSKVLSGSFTNNGREGRFTFLLDGRSFTGKWKWKEDVRWRGNWNGNKADK